MTEKNVDESQLSERLDEFDKDDVDRAARDIILIEKDCFYGDEPERNRLKKIRDKLLNILSDQ